MTYLLDWAVCQEIRNEKVEQFLSIGKVLQQSSLNLSPDSDLVLHDRNNLITNEDTD